MAEIESRKIWDIDRAYPGKGSWGGQEPPRSQRTGGEIHPDLVRFKGHWYCGFKESGRSRIIRSADGEAWETVKLFDWEGVWNGRPYLSVTSENVLMVNSWAKPLGPTGRKGAATGESRIPRQYAVSWLSEDGENWGTVNGSLAPILFSTTWFDGVGYAFGARDGTLYFTLDGKAWHPLAENQYPDRGEGASFDPHDLGSPQGTVKRRCSEGGLAFDPKDARGFCLLRTDPVCAMVGVADPPNYDNWTWRETQVKWTADGDLVPANEVMGVQLGGPVLKHLSDGRLFGAGRADNSTPTTPRARQILFFVNPKEAVLTPFAKLDGFGHYSGVVEHEGKLWIACGGERQHDAYEVFLVKIDVPG